MRPLPTLVVAESPQVHVDVLEQEKQLAELEALERQLRVWSWHIGLSTSVCSCNPVWMYTRVRAQEEQLAFEMEKRAIAEEVERLDRQQAQSLIESQKQELLMLQKKKLELEEVAKEKEQAVKEMTEKLEQEERERVKKQQEREQLSHERTHPARLHLREASRKAAVDAAERIAQARAEAKAVRDELDALTRQLQRLKDSASFPSAAPATATPEPAHISDPDLERMEAVMNELKSKASRDVCICYCRPRSRL